MRYMNQIKYSRMILEKQNKNILKQRFSGEFMGLNNYIIRKDEIWSIKYLKI